MCVFYLVSPKGRDVAQRQRGLGSLFEGAVLPPCGKTEGVLQIDKIRMRFALVQTCSRAALSGICPANASSPKGRAKKPVRTVRLTNQVDSHTDLLACCSFRHGLRRATFLREEGFCLAQFNSSLPLGEMSRSDREGWYPLAWVLKVYPDTNLPVCCPLSHLLRKCQLSQRESREAGANCAPDESELLCQKLALSCAEC